MAEVGVLGLLIALATGFLGVAYGAVASGLPHMYAFFTLLIGVIMLVYGLSCKADGLSMEEARRYARGEPARNQFELERRKNHRQGAIYTSIAVVVVVVSCAVVYVYGFQPTQIAL